MKLLRCLAATLAVLSMPCGPGPAMAAGLPEWLDPARRDAARVEATQNPLGFPLRDHTNAIAGQLGFGVDDRFELTRAHVDERGTTHAVLQQTRQGVPVFGAGLIAHRDARGGYERYTDSAIRDIRTSSRPRVSSASAVAIVEGDRSHRHPFAAPPSASLFFYPQFQRTLASGAPLPANHYDPRVPHSMVESTNAADVVKKLVAMRLAWRITGVEQDSATNEYRPAFWWVDAHSGAILDTGEFSHSAGSGSGAIHAAVTFETSDEGSCFVMEDGIRQFHTETEDFSTDEPVNCDGNDVWGDGLAFVGDSNSPSNANWQTAMVDGHYAATVYWDMMDNVFGIQGPDDDYYSVNLFMHHGTEHSNAYYHHLSGNVVFGDGTDGIAYTRTDVIGHELGHAWDDHNSQFDSSSLLNESIADILGEFTDTYLAAGFASSSSLLGDYADNPSNWVQSIGRNLANPNASGHSAYWHPLIYDDGVHDGSLPASRAFTFLANGASPWVDAPNYSRAMPWGLYGVGLQSAAKAYIKAHREYLLSGEFLNQREAVEVAMATQWGLMTSHHFAVMNAYAAINVGSPAPMMPGPPPDTIEAEQDDPGANNDTKFTAEHVGLGMAPPPGAALPSPHKIRIQGGGDDPDFYGMRLNGNRIAVLITPLFTGSMADYQPYALAIVDAGQQFGVLAVATESVNPQVLAVDFPSNGARDLRVVVLSSSATPDSRYQLDIDLDQTVP